MLKGREIEMGTRVAITLSDPWDLVTNCGSGPFNGTVVDAASTELLIELDEPLKHTGQEMGLALCRARHAGTTVADLSSSLDTPANILLLAGRVATRCLLAEARTLPGVGTIGSIRKLV